MGTGTELAKLAMNALAITLGGTVRLNGAVVWAETMAAARPRNTSYLFI